MATGSDLQSFILNLESGNLATWIQRGLLAVLAISIAISMIFFKFQNFGNPAGYDQAQIARELARGHGFSTKSLLPVDLQFLQQRGEPFRGERMPELRHAPLSPLVNSLAYKTALEDPLKMDENSTQLVVDRVVVAIAIVLFLGAVVFSYFIAARLFDPTMALLMATLLLFTNIFWEFTMSGLPHMLMLFLFTGMFYFVVRATGASEQGAGRPLVWIILAGIFAGLLVLAHGLAIWLVLGLLAYILIFFRDRWIYGPVFAVAALAIMSPWLFRNLQVSGSIFGRSTQAFQESVLGDEGARVLRGQFEPDYGSVTLKPIRKKVLYEFNDQLQNLLTNWGFNLVALIYFVGLLHPFKRPDTNKIKWAILLCLASLVIGMAFFTSDAKGVDINQLHILLLPVAVIYGLAFLIVLWNRSAPPYPLLKAGGAIALVILCGYPLVLNLLTATFAGKYWPPYFPPALVELNELVRDDEVVVTDIPNAVAYHADRYALHRPDTVKSVIDLADFRTLNMDVGAIYLTPRSGDKSYFTYLLAGPEEREKGWHAIYLNWMDLFRTGEQKFVAGFPLDQMRIRGPQFKVLLMIDSQRYKEVMEEQSLQGIDERAAGLDEVEAPFQQNEEEAEAQEEGSTEE